jgi:hypothetical protein
MDTKRYVHDCDDCVFLGRWKEYDLYIHPNTNLEKVNFIARFSDNGPDYYSGRDIALEQHQAALNGGMLLPLGMAVTKAKLTRVVCQYVPVLIN